MKIKNFIESRHDPNWARCDAIGTVHATPRRVASHYQRNVHTEKLL